MCSVRMMWHGLLRATTLIIIFIILFGKTYIAKAECLSNKALEEPKYITFLTGAGVVSDHVLFDTSDGLWFPGCKRSKTFFVKNQSYSSCSLDSIKFDNLFLKKVKDLSDVSSDVYDDFMHAMNAELSMDDVVIFSGEFLDIENSKNILKAKGTIPSGKSKEFKFTVWMDEDAGENLQDLICKFDFIVQCSAYDKGPHNKRKIKHTVEKISVPPEPIDEVPEPEPEPEVLAEEDVNDEEPNVAPLPKTGSSIDMGILLASGFFMIGLGYTVAGKKL